MRAQQHVAAGEAEIIGQLTIVDSLSNGLKMAAKKRAKKNKTADFTPLRLSPSQFSQHATVAAVWHDTVYSRAESLVDFLRHASGLLDANLEAVVQSINHQAKLILNQETSDNETEQIREILTWRSHEEFVAELLLARLSDNYLIFLTVLANHIFRTNPNTMKSEKTETHEFILQHSSMDKLVADLADRLTDKLSTFQQIKDCFHKSLGLPLYLNQADIDLADEIVSVRNVIFHTHGIIDNQFIRRFPDYRKIDAVFVDDDVAMIKLNLSHVSRYGEFLAKSVADIDRRAAVKFNLPIYSYER